MRDKLFIQRGSFGYVCVRSFDANPEWKNRPFEVVAIEELEHLKNKIKIMREALEFYAAVFQADALIAELNKEEK